jgi:hypothetical protein
LGCCCCFGYNLVCLIGLIIWLTGWLVHAKEI